MGTWTGEVQAVYDSMARQQEAATLKGAFVAARCGMRRQQEAGLKELNGMLRRIRETGSKMEAVKWGMVAAGYANGMCCGDLMSKSELQDVIQVIDQAYREAELRITAASHPFWMRIIRKLVRT